VCARSVSFVGTTQRILLLSYQDSCADTPVCLLNSDRSGTGRPEQEQHEPSTIELGAEGEQDTPHTPAETANQAPAIWILTSRLNLAQYLYEKQQFRSFRESIRFQLFARLNQRATNHSLQFRTRRNSF
jgi:hypothetical protein